MANSEVKSTGEEEHNATLSKLDIFDLGLDPGSHLDHRAAYLHTQRPDRRFRAIFRIVEIDYNIQLQRILSSCQHYTPNAPSCSIEMKH